MHKLGIKQSHESILILLRYRTNGHNASVFYCMRETAIVYITVVILLTARKTGASVEIHPMKTDRMSNIATTTVIEKHPMKTDRVSNIATTTVIEKHPMKIDRMSNIATTTVIEKHPMKIDRMSNIATTSVIEKQKCILTQVL